MGSMLLSEWVHLPLFLGFLSEKHSAKHPVQEMLEERKLFYNENE